MENASFSDRTSSDQQDADRQGNAEIEELLLADLADAENADSFVDDLSGQTTSMGKTLADLQAARASAEITGGDLDDDGYQAEVVGEEAVGGQTPTPDQSVTEDLQKAVGISAADGEAVRTTPKLEWRDHHPWQLRPESAEDYQQRLEMDQQDEEN